MGWPRIAAAFVLLLVGSISSSAAQQTSDSVSDVDAAALAALSGDPTTRQQAIAALAESHDHRAVAPLIQLLRWVPEEDQILAGLRALTAAQDVTTWFDWMVWQQAHPEFQASKDYAAFLAELLARIDPQFHRFIRAGIAHDIRLEEIAWGGVGVDGIPALDDPHMIAGAAATYLNSDDLVFGVYLNGDARAYPLRIANWHEMVNDTVGGVPVSLAYCTLCGAGILFDGRVPGRETPFSFGTSGLLYRSNKLMYDRQTDSLWNQFTGRPVVGPLARSGIALKVLPIVIAPWARWLKEHPDTTVLSLETGHARDYGPGVAYHDYFASADLMFPALAADHRLKQKDLVFGVRAPGGAKAWPLDRFKGGDVVNDRVGFLDVVLVGDAGGRTVRAYERRGRTFAAASGNRLTSDGTVWQVTEAALVAPDGTSLPRLPGHIAYWFAWSGYFEDAELGSAPQ